MNLFSRMERKNCLIVALVFQKSLLKVVDSKFWNCTSYHIMRKHLIGNEKHNCSGKVSMINLHLSVYCWSSYYLVVDYHLIEAKINLHQMEAHHDFSINDILSTKILFYAFISKHPPLLSCFRSILPKLLVRRKCAPKEILVFYAVQIDLVGKVTIQ